ncbi:hypothetical protein AMBAS45_16375 [Alteromonas macleodii str. 'Balearic Sea AD45']|uniref:hypothetical protein n=1 Tax=Alteromonas macleodii TaxID=28108 RepID=UPI000286FE02|nr:hypothetical protein [Alteromonas macleodii]AFT96736.1 hypothetical protein AMBAS45_16375 [Alteromonas macleodii str. 'Balearic Sea AD45']PTT96770.1 hypothetical protein DBR45_42050 [Pseudomonas sp. HMWF031]
MRTSKRAVIDIVAKMTMQLLRTFAYCSVIVFVLNTIFNVELNKAITIEPNAILCIGLAAFLTSSAIKIYLLNNSK